MKKLLALLTILVPLYAFAADTGAKDTQLYAYETSAGMSMGAVFGALPNVAEDDELLSVSSPICDHVEIHKMQEENGIMKMRRVDSLALSKGSANMLAPTGYHLMLIQLKSPLKDGQSFPLTLTFKKSEKVTLEIPVTTRKAK